MEHKTPCNRKDDVKGYSAPHGIKQVGGCRPRLDAVLVDALARIAGGTTFVVHGRIEFMTF